ncbi:MAG TPA: hypothetical protein VGU73_08845 [Acidimicrobiia bacterium]|nr:hypothetical protein [Acidimicrobiia bacterium]
MGHVMGAGSGLALLQLAVNAAILTGRRGRRPEHLPVLQALHRPATAAEAASERRTVELVLSVVRAQRAAEPLGP